MLLLFRSNRVAAYTLKAQLSIWEISKGKLMKTGYTAVRLPPWSDPILSNNTVCGVRNESQSDPELQHCFFNLLLLELPVQIWIWLFEKIDLIRKYRQQWKGYQYGIRQARIGK
jgi:hypothetical protein